MDKGVVENYYNMTTIDENMNWMKDDLLSKNPFSVKAPLYTSTFTSRFLIAYLNVQINTSYYVYYVHKCLK